jgi:hypothetical protein
MIYDFIKSYEGEQVIGQLEKIKGGYFFLKIDAEIINKFEKKRHTRMICHLDNTLSFRCGLNHLGDGNYFIIVSTKNLEKINKQLGSKIRFKIEQDPDQLGVEIPEVLEVLLAQDSDLKAIFEEISDGKKRSLIYAIQKIKDIDKQINDIVAFLNKEKMMLHKKKKI